MKSIKHQELEILPFFSDGMILQRNKPLKFWGWDKPNTDLIFHFKQRVYDIRVNEEGYWEISIESQPAGGPYQITIEGTSQHKIQDIYIGEVWLAGGQSNMELSIQRVAPFYPSEIEGVHLPLVRQFQVTQTQNFYAPQERTEGGTWIKAIPSEIHAFSGIGFFFAKNLYESLNVPIGIYLTAVGGTPAEAWISEESLNKIGNFQEQLSYLKNDTKVNRILEKDTKEIEQWYKIMHATDRGLHEEIPWYAVNLADESWDTITLPQMFRDTPLENLTGVVWLRKEIELDAGSLAEPNLAIWLGTLIDADDIYINGVHIGRTDYRYPPRIYPVDNDLLKIGKNILTVRLEITNGIGGFIPKREYVLKGKTIKISLEGEWRYKVATVMDRPLKQPLTLHNKPTGLYNGILYPLRKLSVQGAIYYQGESNADQPDNYGQLMEQLIADWRMLWGSEMPFYFVQLANYFEPTASVDDRNWAVIRKQQDQVSRKLDNVGLVSAIDVGEDNELHPPEKMTVATRLANFALNRVYNTQIQDEHHRLEKIIEAKGSYCLLFEPSPQHLSVENKKEPDIELQQADGKWVDASSIITKTSIKVLKDPKETYQAIRYAWRNAPKGVLVDCVSKLPVLPFIEKL